MTTWEFACSEPASLTIDNWASGSVAVSGEQTGEIVVEVVASQAGASVDDLLDEVRVSFDNGNLHVSGPRHGSWRRKKGLDLTIKAPTGSACAARAAAADVACVGELGELTLHTASGDVTVAAASGPVAVQTASGDVFVSHATADVRISTASGDAQVAHSGGEVRINTSSGDLAVSDCAGSVIAHAASGEIDVKDLSAGHADLVTVSGDVQVSVAPGIGVYLDLASTSGSVRSDLDVADADTDAPDASLEIKCRTISGDIRISKAQSAAA